MADSGLNRLETRMWVSYFQDGMWDVFMGVLMLSTALRTFVDHWLISIVGLLACMSVLLIKKFVTVRRIGLAKFARKRRRRRIVMFSVILAANIVTLILLLFTLIGAEPSMMLRIAAIGSLCFFTFSAVAYLLDFWRFFLWGALFTFALIVTEAVGNDLGSYLFLGTGSLAMIVGMAYFITFIRRYPAERGVYDGA